MVINRNSWHFRVWLFTQDNAPDRTSLCSYVWNVVVYAPMLGLIFVVSALILGPFFLIARGLQVAAIFPFGYRPTGWWFDENVKSGRASTLVSNKPASLLTSWISAKKQKVCPIVEFE